MRQFPPQAVRRRGERRGQGWAGREGEDPAHPEAHPTPPPLDRDDILAHPGAGCAGTNSWVRSTRERIELMRCHQCQSRQGDDAEERRTVTLDFDGRIAAIEVPVLYISMDTPAPFD
jgi:hypothetical protein